MRIRRKIVFPEQCKERPFITNQQLVLDIKDLLKTEGEKPL